MANQQIERRRTFAIIAHPDAGKTSLTENCCFWRTDPGGRSREVEQDQKDSNIRLDGHRKAAWYLGNHFGDGV